MVSLGSHRACHESLPETSLNRSQPEKRFPQDFLVNLFILRKHTKDLLAHACLFLRTSKIVDSKIEAWEERTMTVEMGINPGGNMKFVEDDGGRSAAGYKSYAGDCVCRAVTIASGLPYAEVYEALAKGSGNQRKSKRTPKKSASARNGISVKRQWFKDYMHSIGFEWVPTMLVGQGCKVHLSAGELPMGRLVVSVSKHYTCVVDGKVHDTWNPQREIAMFRQFPGWQTAALKTGEKRNQNGIYTIARRCVYGY